MWSLAVFKIHITSLLRRQVVREFNCYDGLAILSHTQTVVEGDESCAFEALSNFKTLRVLLFP